MQGLLKEKWNKNIKRTVKKGIQVQGVTELVEYSYTKVEKKHQWGQRKVPREKAYEPGRRNSLRNMQNGGERGGLKETRVRTLRGFKRHTKVQEYLLWGG